MIHKQELIYVQLCAPKCTMLSRQRIQFWNVSADLNINHNRIFAVLIFKIQIGHQFYVQKSRTIVLIITFWAVEICGIVSLIVS